MLGAILIISCGFNPSAKYDMAGVFKSGLKRGFISVLLILVMRGP